MIPDPVTLAQTTGSKYEPGMVHRVLSAFISEKLKAGGARIIINMPPRHGKSRLVAVETPLWAMANGLAREIVCASYSLDLAIRHSREVRERIAEPAYAALTGLSVRGDHGAADYWSASSGATYKAVGVGGSLTGHGADLLILDDLHKDAAEANSPTMRQRVWEWLLSVAMTRLSPKANVVLIGTRWHLDDVTGRLLAEQPGEWTLVNLPALAEDNDPLGRLPGEALWPERFSAEDLAKIRQTSSNYFWSALFCGSPVAAGGNYVETDRIVVDDPAGLDPESRRVRFWDLAASEKQTADYTAGALCAREGDTFWILDVTRQKLEWPRARGLITYTASQDRVEVGIEAVAGFLTAFHNLREVWPQGGGHLAQHPAEKDKLTRALPWFSSVMGGRVKMAAAPWNAAFLQEVGAFPLGDHDDQVDAVSGAFNLLFPANPAGPMLPLNTRRADALQRRREREVLI